MDDSLMGVSSGSALMREGPEVGGEVAMVVEAEVVAEDTEEEEMIVAMVEVEIEGIEMEGGDVVIPGNISTKCPCQIADSFLPSLKKPWFFLVIGPTLNELENDRMIPGTDVAPGLAVTPAVAETGVMTGIGGTGAGRRGRLGAGPGHRI